jgi:hypothetical protein
MRRAGQVDRVLLGDTLVLVDCSQARLLHHQSVVGATGVVHIVDESCQHEGKVE